VKLRSILLAVLCLAALFGASVGVLELGLRPLSAANQLGLRELQVLRHSRDAGAVLDVGGRRLLASCRRFRGRDLVTLSDGTQLVMVGVHVFPGSSAPVANLAGLQELLAVHRGDPLIAVRADLVGSHALWIRELTSRIELGGLAVHPVLFDGRRAEELVLTPRRPFLALIVERSTLRPLGAIYDSRSTDASSRIVDSHLGFGPGC
jgi:hypothetical protein